MVIATVRGKVLVCVHASQQHRAQRLPLQSHQSMRARPRVWPPARPTPSLSLWFSFCPKGAQRKGVFGNSSVQVCRTCSSEHPHHVPPYGHGGLPNSARGNCTRLCTHVLYPGSVDGCEVRRCDPCALVRARVSRVCPVCVPAPPGVFLLVLTKPALPPCYQHAAAAAPKPPLRSPSV